MVYRLHQASTGMPLLSQIHGVSHDGSEDPLAGLMGSFTSITPGDPPHIWITVTNTNTDTVLRGARHTAGALHDNIWHLAKIISHVGSWCFSF